MDQMKLFQKTKFNLDGKDYEIRVLYDDFTVNVAAFLNKHPANGYRYQVHFPKTCKVEDILKKHPVPELVENCKNDLIGKRWETLSQVIYSE